MRARIALTLIVISGLALAPAAHGATRIGQAVLSTSGLTNEPCSQDVCTYIQYTDNGTTAGFTSPVTGVITQWQLASGSAGNPVTLRVLRPGLDAGTFAGLGTGVPRVTEAGLNNFVGERLFIEAGQSLGLNDAQGLFFATGQIGAIVKWWSPQKPDASGNSAPNETSAAGHALQINATVEPDADGDRYGDETQDGCPGDATRRELPCSTGPTNPIIPILNRLKLSRSSIRFGQTTAISFRLSKPAHWTLRFEQKRKGRVKRGKCRLQTRSNNSGRRCTLYTSRGTVNGDGGPGGVSVAFAGALASRRSIPPGNYRVKATAQDAIGTSKPAYALLTLRPKLGR